MVTLTDVAKKANVSKMTVSRVINHPELVTDELKKLVFDAMHELNYRPNAAAKALANNRTQIIKFFILEEMDTTEPYYMNLLMGIAQELDKHQYSMQLVTKNAFDIGVCDGYIITGFREKDLEWIEKLEAPVVLFGENRYGIDYIDTNNEEGTRISTEYALAQKYQHIIYIGIDINEAFEFSREAGYVNAMQAHGLVPTIHRFDNHSRYAAKFIEDNWGMWEQNTCFVCSSDRLALGIERGLIKMDGNVPEQFGVIGFDGVFLDQIGSPQLTTVKQPIMDMGAACVTMLLSKMNQNNARQGYKRFEPQLIKRGSTRVIE
ncbi:Catabolite control protein [Listeria grayi]|uniref:Transcriptional regulator n=1 Tax=Listeria grayi FSL F6-1183 TaxID=1265827 RepID=A0A829R4R0_LISGR|nr:LacI family DNA-binding transcriptional regulator [Listeria grayi]EUJ25820.1 transcriptional regulator [Listeria grayi FSL F6-1183]MBC1921624.1 LacI family transcriptional regulator [Listeria grayi]VEI31458.1 Catabolite control protein [Listeria grayi]